MLLPEGRNRHAGVDTPWAAPQRSLASVPCCPFGGECCLKLSRPAGLCHGLFLWVSCGHLFPPTSGVCLWRTKGRDQDPEIRDECTSDWVSGAPGMSALVDLRGKITKRDSDEPQRTRVLFRSCNGGHCRSSRAWGDEFLCEGPALPEFQVSSWSMKKCVKMGRQVWDICI